MNRSLLHLTIDLSAVLSLAVHASPHREWVFAKIHRRLMKTRAAPGGGAFDRAVARWIAAGANRPEKPCSSQTLETS